MSQVNTMSTFGAHGLQDIKQAAAVNQPTLREKWAPGFEPNNMGPGVFSDVTQWMVHNNVTTMATWQVHESNVGDQPEWLFDVIGAFLDANL